MDPYQTACVLGVGAEPLSSGAGEDAGEDGGDESY